MTNSRRLHILVLTMTLLSWSSIAAAGSVTLAWDAVADASVSNYKVCWGTQSGVYPSCTPTGNVTTYTVGNLSDGTAYFFVVKSTNTSGVDSSPSTEVSRRVGVPYSVGGDINGDGATDFTIFRPSTGVWHTRNTSGTFFSSVQWGVPTDVPAAGDFDGDGKIDSSIFRPSNGMWYWRSSATGGGTGIQWGTPTDKPVPADYDGDGKADVAVWRSSYEDAMQSARDYEERAETAERERDAARAALRPLRGIDPLRTEPDRTTYKIDVTAREIRAAHAAMRDIPRPKSRITPRQR